MAPEQVPQMEQELLGGYGLAPSEPAPVDMPVEVAPVPQQWSQPAEGIYNAPSTEQRQDPMDLEVPEPAELAPTEPIEL